MRAARRFLPILLGGILLYINVPYVYKYSARFTVHYKALTLLFTAVYGVSLVLIWKFATTPHIRKIILAIAAVYTISFPVLFRQIPQSTLNIDRYEMINLFWDNAFGGRNPYIPKAEGTNIPGPFPFYFVLALPFYLIGETGFFTLAGFILFAVLLFCQRTGSRGFTVAWAATLLSPGVGYEILCRSTIFLNSTLFLTLILCAQHFRRYTKAGSIVLGICTGLLMSTRSVGMVMLLPFFIILLRDRTRQLNPFLFVLTAGAACGATFVPFLTAPSFVRYNPFMVQNMYIPAYVKLLFLVIACIGGVTIRTFSSFMIFETLYLAALLGYYNLEQFIRFGIGGAIFGNEIDITYFHFVTPFAIYTLAMVLSGGSVNPRGDVTTAPSAGGENASESSADLHV